MELYIFQQEENADLEEYFLNIYTNITLIQIIQKMGFSFLLNNKKSDNSPLFLKKNVYLINNQQQ